MPEAPERESGCELVPMRRDRLPVFDDDTDVVDAKL